MRIQKTLEGVIPTSQMKRTAVPRQFELDAIDHDLLVSFELIHEALDRCDGKHATAHECCSSVDRPFAETERADGHIRLSRLLRIDDEHFEERHGFPGCDYCAAMARKGILSSVNNAFLTGCYPALFKLAHYPIFRPPARRSASS